jgi:hypothetical protein
VSGIFPGDKSGRCVELTFLPLCASCLEILKPQPTATLRACPGLYRDYYILAYVYVYTNVTVDVTVFLGVTPCILVVDSIQCNALAA